MPSAFKSRVGSTLNQKWKLEKLLGSGGMAAVYLARHKIGRFDAIKILHPHFGGNDALRKRFEREALAVNKFEHPGAVKIRDVGVDELDGSPFLVMEHLEGSSLSKLQQNNTLGGAAETGLLEVMVDVLDVLAAAHDQGIVHRDMKPDNILVLADGSVKVLDFGIVRMDLESGSVETREGDVLGTVAYMAPEQASGNDVDLRADIFGVGATLYRMLGGRPIHRAGSAAERLVMMATVPAPPLGQVARVPRNLARIVDRAVAFERDYRYPSARAMQNDLKAYIAGEELADVEPLSSRVGDDLTRRVARVADQQLEDAKELVGTTLAGRYLLQDLLGKGGMGAVYRAQKPDGSLVAVKVVLRHLAQGGTSANARFKREAEASMRVVHDNVVRVLEADVDEALNLPFLVMDLMEGEDTEQLLRRVNPLPSRVAATIIAQACSGVLAAHAKGIVHRDIKPANIFLNNAPNGAIEVKLCDFGLAKTRSADSQGAQSLTRSGGVVGTPKYSSPEQLTNAKGVDNRADVWGLCLSLHEMLSGRKPWESCKTVGKLIVAICTTSVPALGRVAPWADAPLAAIVERGTKRDPAERWASVNELRHALLDYLGDEVGLTEHALVAVDTASFFEPRQSIAPRVRNSATPKPRRPTPAASAVQVPDPVEDETISISSTISSQSQPSVRAVTQNTPPPAPHKSSRRNNMIYGAMIIVAIILAGAGAMMSRTAHGDADANVRPTDPKQAEQNDYEAEEDPAAKPRDTAIHPPPSAASPKPKKRARPRARPRRAARPSPQPPPASSASPIGESTAATAPKAAPIYRTDNKNPWAKD